MPDRYRLPLLVVMILSGLAVNYVKLPLFLNIDFLFGSIFALLALQFFGLGRGLLAAALIAGATSFLWNHPYAIVIMTAEVATVGLLMERRRQGMVLADTLFWLLIGIPLVSVCSHLVMQVPVSNTLMVMSKQAVNGIANALVARLLFTAFVLLSQTAKISLREIISDLLASFVLFPTLIMLMVSCRTDFNHLDRNIRATLVQDGDRAHAFLETWVAHRRSALVNLAALTASSTLPQMQSYLELSRKSDANFVRIGLLDQRATVLAHSPLADESGRNDVGIKATDPSFGPQLDQPLKPMLTEAFVAGGTPSNSTVAMLAPVLKEGRYNGSVIGILLLDQLQRQLDQSLATNATLYSLMDKHGKVLLSNRPDQPLPSLATGIGQWVQEVPPQSSVSERGLKSPYVVEVAVGDLAEWHLLLEQPVAAYQKKLFDSYTGKFSLLFLTLLGSLLLVELVSRRSMQTLDKLSRMTRDLPNQLWTEAEKIVWPKSGIRETDQLISNCAAMADALAAQMVEIGRANKSLKQRLEERTEALRASEIFNLAILDAVTSEIAVLDVDGMILTVNEPWRRFARENGLEPGTGTEIGADYLAVLRESRATSKEAVRSLEGIEAVLNGRMASFHLEYPCHAPAQERWFMMTVTPLGPDRRGVVIVHTDISEYIQVENALQQDHDEMERRVQERTINLFSANEKLRQEIAERRQVEAQLFNSKATLTMALDGISDPLIMLDADLRLQRLNQAAMAYYGLTTDEEVIGKYCFDAFRGRSLPCEGCARPFSALQGFSGTYERPGDRDPDRLQQVVVDLVKDVSGATKATIIRLADITQARMMDRQLIQSEKLATLGLLIAGIAHEINNPNNFIYFNTPILRSYLEFLLPIVDEYVLAHPDLQVFNRPYAVFREDCFKLLANIEHGSIRINQIVGNLKEFVRERGKGEYRRIDLKQVLEKGVFICQGRIRKTVKTFEVDIPDGLPPLISDPLAIEQVVVNLLINAIQAMDKEDSWVRLKVVGPWATEGEVQVEVSDNGCGMESECQRKIFDPFFTTKAPGVGTGLGLSITQRLVAELGGRIEVLSEPGLGSSFRVILKTNQPTLPSTTG